MQSFSYNCTYSILVNFEKAAPFKYLILLPTIIKKSYPTDIAVIIKIIFSLKKRLINKRKSSNVLLLIFIILL